MTTNPGDVTTNAGGRTVRATFEHGRVFVALTTHEQDQSFTWEMSLAPAEATSLLAALHALPEVSQAWLHGGGR